MMRPVLAAAAVLALGGCLFSSEPTRYYSLEPVAPRARTADAGPPIGVDAVSLPPALERPEIVLYVGPGRVEVRGLELWAAEPRAMVTRVLAQDLARRLPEGRVLLPGQPVPDGPGRSLNVVLERFAAGPAAEVVLEAVWTLGRTDGRGTPIARRERIAVPLASTDGDALAAGMSAALAGLADRIVAGTAATNGKLGTGN